MFVQKNKRGAGEDGISKAHAPSGAQTLEVKGTALGHPCCPHFPVGGLPPLFPPHTQYSYYRIQPIHLTDCKTEAKRDA